MLQLRSYYLIIFCLLISTSCDASKNLIQPTDPQFNLEVDTSKYLIPLAGNAFITESSGETLTKIADNGLVNWTNPNTITSVYFRVPEDGKLNLGTRARLTYTGDTSIIKVTIGNQTKTVQISGADNIIYQVSEFDVSKGYIKVDLQGLSKSGTTFGDVSELIVNGNATAGNLVYVNKPDFYLWGRRGPSCHIDYTVPVSEPIEYYYGEVTVPVGEDAVGSFFMSNGFENGYFGMQVYSETERLIIFSVWSPFSTDDPQSIPLDQRVVLNKKGKDVYTGEFGNEGSGGQSLLLYNWKAGKTYRFLLKGKPDGNGSTDYTAWAAMDEPNQWTLIASFKRPKTNNYLKGYSSFLENFLPDHGYKNRKVLFSNRWVRSNSGKWTPITQGKFNVDDTFRKSQRVDAIGGKTGDNFFLQMGGFLNDYVAPGSSFVVGTSGTAPEIDFEALEGN